MSAAIADVVAPRLDLWLADSRQITRHAARTLIDAGLVTVDGRPGRPGQRVRDTADVVVTPPDETLVAAATPRRDPGIPGPELRIVDEDDWLAVVDKPSGMVVHPAPGHPTGTLADALKERGTTWSLLGGAERAGIVHRLDRDTSGLLVVAKTEAAHRNLARQLSDRSLGRTYWALVHGGFREDTGTIDAPIARHPRDRRRMAIVEGGREAMTDFRVLERLAGATVLELSLRTGRTHQIRVHLASIGHPIIGDTVYGRPDPQLPRPALHAMRLRLRHPADGTDRTYEFAGARGADRGRCQASSSIRMSSEGLLVVLTGPSGVGKDTVLRELFALDRALEYCISYTTRPPRPGETDGVSYWFVDEPTFRAMIDRDEFFEWSTVYGELKGRTFETVNKAIASGRDTVIKIDVQGAEKVRTQLGARATYVYLLPPSMEALEQRLIERATEDPASLHARQELAVAELALKDTYDHQVVNDDARRAAQEIEAIIEGLRSSTGGDAA